MQFGAQRALDSLDVDVQSGVTGLGRCQRCWQDNADEPGVGFACAHSRANTWSSDLIREPMAQSCVRKSAMGRSTRLVPEDMPASDFVKHMAEVRGMPRNEARGRASDALVAGRTGRGACQSTGDDVHWSTPAG